MIGKKNIVFGFLWLVLTAALGPYMINQYFGDLRGAQQVRMEKIGALQSAADAGFEMNLEKMSAEDIGKANTGAILALSGLLNAQEPINSVKGGPHTHGNLEAVLNILAGFLLMFLAVPRALKQAISWIFILGAVLHSGLLYLAMAVQVGWAAALLGTPVAVAGPALVLLGLLLAGIAAAMGLRARPVED